MPSQIAKSTLLLTPTRLSASPMSIFFRTKGTRGKIDYKQQTSGSSKIKHKGLFDLL